MENSLEQIRKQIEERKKQKRILEEQGKHKSWAYQLVCNDLLYQMKNILTLFPKEK